MRGIKNCGSSPCSQVTTRIGRERPSPERQDKPQRNPLIAVVVPAAPRTQRRVTRSTTGATARKRRHHQNQGNDSSNHADRLSKRRSERHQQPQKKCRLRPTRLDREDGAPKDILVFGSATRQRGRRIFEMTWRRSCPFAFLSFFSSSIAGYSIYVCRMYCRNFW